MVNIRKLALQAIERVIYKGGYANIVINEYLNKYELDDNDRRLFTKLVLGTVERRITLAYYLEPFLRKKQKPLINCLLLMSVYQLVYLNIPEHVVVNESVKIANSTDRMIGNFINAVLRNFLRAELRTFDNLDEIQKLSVEYSYPTWLVAYLLKDYDYETVSKILAFNDEVKSDAVRINNLKTNYDEVVKVLDKEKIEYQISDLVNDGLIINKSMVNHPLFKEGKITVQDIASQMVTEVTSPEELPLTVVIPAFILSELKLAFQIGFILYIPFLVIDMIVASTLMSMGMMMLPPTTISLPFKILLFVLVDGWNLVVQSVINGFMV